MTDLSVETVRAMLNDACSGIGGQTAWAEDHDICRSFVANVIAGRREPSNKVCAALGLCRIVVYRTLHKQYRKKP